MADLDKDLASLFNVPARRRAFLIQLEGAAAGRWGAKGWLGACPRAGGGRHEGDQPCLSEKGESGGGGKDGSCSGTPPHRSLLSSVLLFPPAAVPPPLQDHLSLSFPPSVPYP